LTVLLLREGREGREKRTRMRERGGKVRGRCYTPAVKSCAIADVDMSNHGFVS